MPLIKQEGKDTIIFTTKEDDESPSKLSLPEPEESPGLILPNGEINWGCPCLGGMATGPCGVEFREAFSCFHYSTAEPKGSDCYEAFKTMQGCMVQYPSVYNKDGADMEEIEREEEEMAKKEEEERRMEMSANDNVHKVSDAIVDQVKSAPSQTETNSEKEVVKALAQ